MAVRDDAPAIELKGPVAGVMIGTPMYGGVCYDAFLLGVFDLQQQCHKLGISLSLHTIRNESLIPRARNRVLADFMDSTASHLVFVDADIGFDGRDVLRLVAHGLPFVGGTYAKKNRHHYDPAFVPLAKPAKVQPSGLVEVACLPGGFMCLTRDAVHRLAGAYRDAWYYDGGTGNRRIHDLCATYTDPTTRQYWSEDYALCQRWREIGGACWLDPFIQLTHNGTTVFESDPVTVFAEAPAKGGKRK